jgi:peptidoglycan/xylan/chitin deacetylase (PgdA/CDA1 family)
MTVLQYKTLIGVFLVSMGATTVSLAFASENGAPGIAKWYGNKAAAVSLRFDDSTDSHVKYVIPKLNEYGIKATFMVNPGLGRYRKNKDFWEREVPRMGHQLGNHTMHHRGAKTPEEADYEIGEVSRRIWRLYPGQSKLLVFASGGGGVRWGGKDWDAASKEYKELVSKYFLIDLYDGRHPYLGANSKHGDDEINRSIENAVQERRHQAIVFHDVGTPDAIDYLRWIKNGYRLTYSRESFEKIIAFLREKEDLLWIAPLGDVLKYEAERDGAVLALLSKSPESVRLALTVQTDPELYDHRLTVILPWKGNPQVTSIVQGEHRIDRFAFEGPSLRFSVRPVNSVIDIRFE